MGAAYVQRAATLCMRARHRNLDSLLTMGSSLDHRLMGTLL